MTTEYRAGILFVAYEFGVARAKRALPLEHRVAAVKAHPVNRYFECLVEGPMLPIVMAEDTLPAVQILTTVTDKEGIYRLDGIWKHARETSWRIGEWPSSKACHAEMDALS